jgi:hypothetical protein
MSITGGMLAAPRPPIYHPDRRALSAGSTRNNVRVVEAPDLPGNPNHVPVAQYISFPLIMAGCALALFAVARYTRFRLLPLIAQGLVFCVLSQCLLRGGGGM